MFAEPVTLNKLFQLVIAEKLTLSGADSYYFKNFITYNVVNRCCTSTIGAVHINSALVSTVLEDQQPEEASTSLRQQSVALARQLGRKTGKLLFPQDICGNILINSG